MEKAVCRRSDNQFGFKEGKTYEYETYQTSRQGKKYDMVKITIVPGWSYTSIQENEFKFYFSV